MELGLGQRMAVGENQRACTMTGGRREGKFLPGPRNGSVVGRLIVPLVTNVRAVGRMNRTRYAVTNARAGTSVDRCPS